MKRALGILVGTIATGTALLAVVAAAHTPWGRPLLAWLPGFAGCPLGWEQADPRKVESFRRERLLARAGSADAREAAAWHFTLGASLRPDVAEELRRQGYDCAETRAGSVLNCNQGRSPSRWARSTSLHLQFDARDRLVAVDWMAEHDAPERAVRELVALRDELRARVGPETAHFGTPSADYLAPAQFRRTAFEYRYASYLAKLSATNLGRGRGFLLRQQYQWLPPDA